MTNNPKPEITGETVDAWFAEARRKHSIDEICVFAQKCVDSEEPNREKRAVDVWLERADMEVLFEQDGINIWQNERQYGADSTYIIRVLFRGFNFFHAAQNPWWKERFPPR